mgnify:FL=1
MAYVLCGDQEINFKLLAPLVKCGPKEKAETCNRQNILYIL